MGDYGTTPLHPHDRPRPHHGSSWISQVKNLDLNHMQQSQPEKALHFLEIILAETPDHRAALETRLSILQYMLERAVADNGGNNYEKDYLRRRIAITEEALAEG